jgi:hypothetical protein
MRLSSRVRRLTRAARKVIAGEPMMTPAAYAVIAYVATGRGTSRSDAVSWMNQLLPNSPVPIAKVPSATAKRVSFGDMTTPCRFSANAHCPS